MSIYLPAHFTSPDPAARERIATQVIAAHPFATLISVRDGEPFVTHCPVTVQADASGAPILEGHMARGNPHWRAWQAGQDRVLVIFHGPHAYVSPTLYEGRENVPTWNYVVVHVRGQAVLTSDSFDDKDALLKRLIAHVEPGYADHWRSLAPDYQHRMLGAIVGFRIPMTEIDVKLKVSQNRLPVDRQRVHDAFSQGSAPEQSLAAWMRQLGAV